MIPMIIIIAVLVLWLINSVYTIWEEHKKNTLCDCPGDCAHCTIQCRSNEKYYGKRQIGVPLEKRDQLINSFKPENLPWIIRVIRKSRDISDKLCWWLFNGIGILVLLRMGWDLIQKAAVLLGIAA